MEPTTSLLLTNDPYKLQETRRPISRTCTVGAKKSPILQSNCTCSSSVEKNEKCKLCDIIVKVPNLHGLPEMLFNENYLKLEHNATGAAIEFNPLDALKVVEETRDPLQVAVADGWQSARADFPFANRILKPYDWTYTSNYKGTLIGEMKVEDTIERIDLNKLKKREEILLYEDLTLYEDELADHGISKYSVKIRAMPSFVYILARFYLRIDDVLVRMNDTRIYHDYRKNYLIREYTNREAKIKNLNLPLPVILEPNELMNHLPIIQSSSQKLTWPLASSQT